MKKILFVAALLVMLPTMAFARGSMSHSFHTASAPHFSAPHVSAPHVSTPHISTPSMPKSAPKVSTPSTPTTHFWSSAPTPPHTIVIVQQPTHSWYSNTWFWMYMMNRNNHTVVNKCFDQNKKEIVCPPYGPPAPVKK